jgi:hypothetical protein
MYNDWKSITTVTNSIFCNNSAVSGSGAGIYNHYLSSSILSNCTFVSNSAGSFGVGICNTGSHATLSNCILWDDADKWDHEIYLKLYNPPAGDHSSTLNVDYSDVQGGASAVYVSTNCTMDWGKGNINADPCFVDAANVDYHLNSQAGRWETSSASWVQDDVTSPCIDAGDPESPIGLEPFPNGGRINMGAFGGTVEASKSYFGGPVCEIIVTGDINGDCKVNFLDFRIMAFNWLKDNSKSQY